MIRPEVRQFVQDVFGSVWTLEVLLLLKRREKPMPLEGIESELRASRAVVEQAADSLFRAGLVLVEGPAAVVYAPSSPDLRALVEETETLYAQRPDALRRIIVSGRVTDISAFSDAFRIRRD